MVGVMLVTSYKNTTFHMPEPFQNFTLVQDNATLHVACEVTNLLENEGVEVMDWPACSLDLNP